MSWFGRFQRWQRRSEIVFLGDSLTAEPEGYVAMVGAKLPRRRVANAGCGATTTWQWTLDVASPGFHCQYQTGVPIWTAMAAPHFPTVQTYIMLGSNDASMHACHPDLLTPVDPDEYERNLRVIVRRALGAGSRGVTLMRSPDPKFGPEDALERLVAYRERVLRVCKTARNVRCGPDMSTVIGPDDYPPDGQLHPTLEGHRKMADAVLADLLG